MYMAGQEYFDHNGPMLDEEDIEGLTDSQRSFFLMGFQSAKAALQRGLDQAVRGITAWVTRPSIHLFYNTNAYEADYE